MKKCILHAGTVKTGTTTIQGFLSKSRRKLVAADFSYSKAMGQANHTALAAFAQNEDKFDDLRFRRGVTKPEQVAKMRDDIQRDFSEEARACMETTTLFSSEHTSSRLVADEEVDRLRTLLSGEFSDVKILFYLRLQDEMALSTHSTGIRNGITDHFDIESYQPTSSVLNYDRLLSRWENVFGKENIVVRLFDRSMFPEGSLLKDFLQTVGADVSLPAQERAANQSYDTDTMELLRMLNQYLPRFHEDGTRNLGRGKIGKFLETVSDPDKRFRLGKDEAEGLMSRFDESNEAVFGRYGLLDDYRRVRVNRGKEDVIEAAPLTLDKATELFAKVWETRELQMHEALEKAKD